MHAALDGWTDLTGKSLWNFILHTSDGKDILWRIQDLSNQSHTGEYLAEKIEEILNDIGIQRFAAIVTDAGSNINLARQIITQKFPHILNIRCIAHCLNLITKDFVKHAFATRILNWSNVVTAYFKKSHLPHKFLEDKIKEKNIKGGGLKTYIHTRWTTAYEMLQSICRLETCLKEVINENPNVITNENVKNIIMRKRGYFQDVQDLAAIIKPIRDLIIQLEGQEANLADCFFSLAQLGAAIKNMPELDHKMFYRHCVESFNNRFNEFDFDEHLLAYYLHPEYQGKPILFY